MIFHKLVLNVENEKTVSKHRWKKQKTEEYQEWKDLLDDINIPSQTYSGTWKLLRNLPEEGSEKIDERKLVVKGEEYARFLLPVVPTGDYQLLVHLTRNAGDGEINLILPVGKTTCMVSVGNEGNEFRIQNVNGKHWGVIKEGIMTNGQQHAVDVEVTLGKRETATILLKIDNQEIFHWEGKQSDLSIREDWNIHPLTLGLGVHQDFVQFQQILFQNNKGTVFQLKQK